MQLLVANNASSTLALGIGAADTSCTLQAATGGLFPNPTTGQYFAATLVSAANGLVKEIVYVTARSGDNVTTMTRAQEGTTAQAFLAGDFFWCEFTAGAAEALTQMTSVAGDPNGVQPGVAASTYGSATMLWDTVSSILWVCTTGGAAGVAVWYPLPSVPLPRIIVLTGPLTLYVAPPPVGSDTANTGLTSDSPFATISHAYYILSTRYNVNGFGVKIVVAAGTYSDSVVMTGTVIGSGNTPIELSANGSVTINAVGSWLSLQQGAWASLDAANGSWTINIAPPAAHPPAAITAATGGRFTLSGLGVTGVIFGDLYVGSVHLRAEVGARIELSGRYGIENSSGDGHWYAHTPGIVFANNVLVDCIGTPSFGVAFAQCDEGGIIECPQLAFTHSYTGRNFSVTLNGVINTGTNAGNVDHMDVFDGTIAGTVGTGGQYN